MHAIEERPWLTRRRTNLGTVWLRLIKNSPRDVVNQQQLPVLRSEDQPALERESEARADNVRARVWPDDE